MDSDTAAAPPPEAEPKEEPGSKLGEGVPPIDGHSESRVMNQYDVCFSYAGEQREYVEAVAAALEESDVRVFYDKYEAAYLWGKDLYQHLADLYQNRGKFCVVFISAAYADKLWTRHELKSAQARAFKENREYILPARFDDTEIPGMPGTIGYIDLRTTTPQQLADLIVQKLKDWTEPSGTVAATPVAAAPVVDRPRIDPIKKKCVDCSELIPSDARRCKHCGTIQDWRLTKLIAVVTALVSGAIYLYTCQAPSRTSFTVSQSDGKAIVYVNISNKGWKKSYLRSCALEFGGLPIERRTLTPVSSDVGVVANGIPHGDVRIGLRVAGLRAKVKPGSKERYTETEIKELMADNPVATLKMEVQESGDPPTGPFHTKDYPFLINAIHKLVLNKLPDEVPQ